METLTETHFFQTISINQILTESELQNSFIEFINRIAIVCDTSDNARKLLRILNYTKIRLQALQEYSLKAEKKCARILCNIYQISNSFH